MDIKDLWHHEYEYAVISLSGYFKGQISHQSNTFYIGVDRGTEHLLRSNIVPHLVIGDLDSISRKALLSTISSDYKPFFLISNWDKDYTDGERAIEIAYMMGIKKVILLGVLGGEMDHFMGNLSLFSMYRRLFEYLIGYTGYQAIFMMEGKQYLHLPVGMPISFIPYDDEILLTLKGVYWEVEDRAFRREALPPISNITTKEEVCISSKGRVWVVIGREDHPYLLKYPQGR